MNPTKPTYHHGDLRGALLDAATALIREAGVDGLSMRKLADRVGVSRTAPYHHFVDKQALLSALAEAGFRRYEAALQQALASAPTADAQLRAFIRCYLTFALAHPESYDLMFGHSVWKAGVPSESLRGEAHRVFKRYVERVRLWQQQQLLPAGVETLRLAQVTWSTLHGLARLSIDGIYLQPNHLDELLDVAERLFRQAL